MSNHSLSEQSEERLIENVILSCISTCEAYAKWTKKDGQRLENGGRIHITQSDDWKKFTLTIKEAREEDEGKYTIELFNYNGKASGSIEVKLMGMFLNSTSIDVFFQLCFVFEYEIDHLDNLSVCVFFFVCVFVLQNLTRPGEILNGSKYMILHYSLKLACSLFRICLCNVPGVGVCMCVCVLEKMIQRKRG